MKYTVEYPVKPNGISQSLIFIEETLEKYHLGQRDLMEALLISEETLMMLEENASEEAVIKITISKHMGVPRIKIIVPGTALTLDEHMGSFSFEQLGGEADSAIRSIMLRSYSDSIKYKHTRSLNILTITTGIPERILSTYTITAILLAVITGFVFKLVLPEEAIQWMLMNICDPVETLFISALMCITAPAVFISITCSMFKFEGLSELGENGKRAEIAFLSIDFHGQFPIAYLVGQCIRRFRQTVLHQRSGYRVRFGASRIAENFLFPDGRRFVCFRMKDHFPKISDRLAWIFAATSGLFME